MTKRSRCSMHASHIGLVGLAASCKKVSVTAGKFFQTVNVVFLLSRNRAPVAQLVEHRAVTREVVSSTPAGPTLSVFK